MEDRPSLVEATTVVRQSLDTSEQRNFSEGIQGANLSSNSCQTSQYRIADVAFFPASDRRVLTYLRGTEVKRLLQRPVANLLAQCREFRTLDEHVDTYCREQQLSGTMLETIRSKFQHQLHQLAQEGYLISSNQLRQLFQAASLTLIHKCRSLEIRPIAMGGKALSEKEQCSPEILGVKALYKRL